MTYNEQISVRSAAHAARCYRGQGWSVIPIGAGSKRPLVRWEEYEYRLPTEEEIQRWFRSWPDAGVAVVTGSISGLVVVDVDLRHGGEASLRALEHVHGALPSTVEALTGGGGRHLYFAHPGRPIRNQVAVAPGIDLRGDGGYVVAPPSVHPSGRRYAWVAGRAPEETSLAPLPAWLLHEVTAEGRVGHPLGYWRDLVRSGVGEGERNNTIASLTGHLLWHGVQPEVALELLLCWNRVRCRPPLPDDEVARTVESITRLHQRHEAVPERAGPSDRGNKTAGT